VPSLIGHAAHTESTVGSHTILVLGLLVLVLRTERSDMFGDKVVLFEEALDARSWNCTDGKPVPDTVLVKGDLTGNGLFLEGCPNTHML
jgi:hypothetical protein